MADLTLKAETLIGRLPYFWHEYPEMTELQKALGIELTDADKQREYILQDAFIMSMGESRIQEWEKWLDLPPTGTLEDRRLAILGYFAVISKLTRESIQTLTASLYNGARAIVKFKDSTIYITIKPLPENAFNEIDFNLILTQLKRRKPCHISLYTDRYIGSWGEVKSGLNTWQNVKNTCGIWDNVYLYIRE